MKFFVNALCRALVVKIIKKIEKAFLSAAKSQRHKDFLIKITCGQPLIATSFTKLTLRCGWQARLCPTSQ
jgi:hypothetical protein